MANNRFALNAGWNEEVLAEELLAIDLDFDIGVTGFWIAEIDSLPEGLEPRSPANRKRAGCPKMMERRAAGSAISGSLAPTG